MIDDTAFEGTTSRPAVAAAVLALLRSDGLTVVEETGSDRSVRSFVAFRTRMSGQRCQQFSVTAAIGYPIEINDVGSRSSSRLSVVAARHRAEGGLWRCPPPLATP